MKKKVLVITRKIFLDLLQEGMEDFSLNSNDWELSFFCLDYAKYSSKGIDLIRYKYNIKDFRKKYYDRERKKLCKIIEEYDTIFFVNLFWDKEYFIQGELINILKSKKCIVHLVDSLKTIPQNINFFHVFDRVYSFEYGDIQYAKEKFDLDIAYASASTHYYLYGNNNSRVEPLYDLCFICAATPKRLAYLDRIVRWCSDNNKSIFIAGKFWHTSNFWNSYMGKLKFKYKYPFLAKYVINRFITPRELARIYEQSKICLNINVEYHKSVNRRAYDIMFCHSLLLCDEQDLEGTDIVPERDFIMAKDPDDMIDKIAYYLSHEDLRKSIASNGKLITDHNHLYKQVLEKMLEGL